MNLFAEVPCVLEILGKYTYHLLDRCQCLETKLIAEYSGEMAATGEEQPVKRESYARDIYIWMALAWIKQYITDRIAINQGINAEDCGFELYSQISEAGKAYFDPAMASKFGEKFPITKKVLTVVGNHV